MAQLSRQKRDSGQPRKRPGQQAEVDCWLLLDRRGSGGGLAEDMEDLPTGVGGRCEIFYTKFSDDLIVLAPNADQVDGIMSTAATLNLVSVRQSRGLTLEEITRATRIAPRYLNAIEAEDFAKLPGGVYAVSYLRQYARAIGFSEVELLDRYYALKQPEPAPVLALKQSSRPKTRLGESLAHLFGHLSPKPRTQHPA